MREILDIFIFKEKPSWISDMFLIKRMKDCLKNISEIFYEIISLLQLNRNLNFSRISLKNIVFSIL